MDTPINFRLALDTQHADCHKAADAFWDYWKANGETHKHGFYESTWGAINRAIRLVGVRPWGYGSTPAAADGEPQFETCPCGTWGRWKPMPLASMQTEAVASPSECDSLTDRGATPAPQTRAVLDVLAERRRQIEAKGWTPGHDDKHADGSMAAAAGCYAIHAAIASGINSGELDRYAEPWRRFDKAVPDFWPWDCEWWKPTVEPRRNLVKAGALILAEIERLDRAPGATPGGQEGEGAA